MYKKRIVAILGLLFLLIFISFLINISAFGSALVKVWNYTIGSGYVLGFDSPAVSNGIVIVSVILIRNPRRRIWNA